MTEIITVKDASQSEFRRLGVGEDDVWVELEDLEEMKSIAEELDVKFIYKKGGEYFFRANEITHYYQE